MKKLYVGYPTALEIWDVLARRGRARMGACDPAELKDCSGSLATLRASAVSSPEWAGTLQTPIHALVSDISVRSRNASVTTHVWSASLPAGSLRRLDDVTAVASPALCFLLAATQLGLVDLMQLGLEICGTYSSGPDGRQEVCGIARRTSVATIRTMLVACDVRGCATSAARVKALRATDRVIERVASPMECVVYLLLCLPYRLGGYGLPRPQANLELEVPRQFRRRLGARHVVPDLCWPEQRVCVEYDSDEHHRGGVKAARDSVRRDALAAMGLTVHTLNMAQLQDSRLFDPTARQIAAELGKRLRDTPGAANYQAVLDARRELRRALLDRGQAWKRPGS